MFDRELLVAETDTVAPMLEVYVDPTRKCHNIFLEEPLRTRTLDWLMGWVIEARSTLQMRMDEASELDTGLHLINQSTYVALQNLDIHSRSIKAGVSKLETIATKDFSSMKELLSRYEWDLAVLERIHVHPELLRSPRESESSPPSRTLAQFVNPSNVRELAQSCEKDMRALHDTYSSTMKRELQLSLDLYDLTEEVKRTDLAPSEELFAHIRHIYTQAMALVESIRQQCLPPSHPAATKDTLSSDLCAQLNSLCTQLSAQEADIIHSVEELAADRNELQGRHLNLIQDIGSLQSDFAELSDAVAQIDRALQSPPLDRFDQLQRLTRMGWAYGATLIEAVRRTEFSSRFLQQAQGVAELMAHVSDREIARRQSYAADIAPLVPWDVWTMEQSPPMLDITTRRRDTTAISSSFSRSDIDDFFEQLEHIDADVPNPEKSSLAADLREALQPLLFALDDGEAEFHRTARKQLGLSMLSDEVSEDSINSDTPSTNSTGPTGETSRLELLESQLHAAQERIKRLESELTLRTGKPAPSNEGSAHAWATKAHQLTMCLRAMEGKDQNDELDALEPDCLEEVRKKLDQLSTRCWDYEQAPHDPRAAQLSVAFFEVGSLALFLPTQRCEASSPVWAAFHVGAPHHFLRIDEKFAHELSHREWLLARIVRLTRHVATLGNVYGLAADTPYTLVDVDGWQDPASLVHPTSRSTSPPSQSPSPSMLSRWPWRQAFFTPMHAITDCLPRPVERATATTSTTTAMAEFVPPQSPPST